MSLLSKLFGLGSGDPGSSGPKREARPEQYEGYRIFPEPAKTSGGYRIGARIEKEVGGEVKTHAMIRADTYGDADTATEASVTKAKMLIDQQGEAIFR